MQQGAAEIAERRDFYEGFTERARAEAGTRAPTTLEDEEVFDVERRKSELKSLSWFSSEDVATERTAALRLICVPGAGMTATAFGRWRHRLRRRNVAVVAAHLPGRLSRNFEETVPANVQQLAAELASSLRGHGMLPRKRAVVVPSAMHAAPNSSAAGAVKADGNEMAGEEGRSRRRLCPCGAELAAHGECPVAAEAAEAALLASEAADALELDDGRIKPCRSGGEAKNAPPLAFFGHELGALVAFEAARLLEGDGVPVAALFVSGMCPPQLAALRDRLSPLIHRDASGHLLHAKTKELEDRLRVVWAPLMPAEMQEDRGVLRLFMPLVADDLELLDGYEYSAGPPLACPVFAAVDASTSDAKVGDLHAWGLETLGPCRAHVLTAPSRAEETAARDACYLPEVLRLVEGVLADGTLRNSNFWEAETNANVGDEEEGPGSAEAAETDEA